MLTIFEQSDSNNFNITNKNGIKRIKKLDGPTNFYQQIEYNADRLLTNFPQKDKLQLMKLLEDLDNQVEVAHEILNSENSQGQNNLNFSCKNQQFNQNTYSEFQMTNNFNNSNTGNNQMNLDQNKYIAPKDVLDKRRIVSNLKPKMIKKDGQEQKQNQQPNGVIVGGQLQQMQHSQQTSVNHQDNQQKLNNANQQQHKNQEDVQQSSTQEQLSHTLQNKQQHQFQQQQYQQQQADTNRIKDLGQIQEFQKQLVDNIIPQLLQELGKSSIQSAPQIIMQAFKWYEEENRKVIKYDQIMSNNQILLKAISNQFQKSQVLQKQNNDLSQQKTQLSNEKEKYRNIAERLQIMFAANNEQKQNYYNDYFDKGGDSGIYQ